VTDNSISVLSKEINQSATAIGRPFLGPNLYSSISKAFALVRGNSAFNTSISSYGSQSFAWGLDFRLNNYQSVVARFSISTPIDNQLLTTAWTVSLLNYTMIGPQTTTSQLVSASSLQRLNWAGWTYSWNSGATTSVVEALSEKAVTAAIIEPPSGQKNSHIDQTAAVWIGVSSAYDGGDILQTGYYNVATTNNGTSSYELWWQFAGVNNLTPYSSTSYANAGDVLYMDANWNPSPTNKAAYELCDVNASDTCYTYLYSPGVSFTPYYAQYITEASKQTLTNGTIIYTQLAKVTHDGGSYGALFNSNEICTSSTCEAASSAYLYDSYYIQQSSSGANTQLKTNDYRSGSLDVVWQNSNFNPSWICTTFGVDCHGF
jgi:hypothetical protein